MTSTLDELKSAGDTLAGNAARSIVSAVLAKQIIFGADGADPARVFGAYSAAFDNKALAIGESIDAAPGVKLTRRC